MEEGRIFCGLFTWNDGWTPTLGSSLVLSGLDQRVGWPFAPFQHKVAVGADIWVNDGNQHYYEYDTINIITCHISVLFSRE